jgi:predicted transcriptional regulator
MSLTSFVLRGFRQPRDVVRSALGELERRVLEELWRREGESSVRDVHAAFAPALAYTTLMTTLDRLHRKGLLLRRRDGRAFVYRPRLTREEFEGQVASQMIDGLLGLVDARPEPVLLSIVDVVGRRDAELLDELERLVREKRQILRGRSGDRR